MAHRIGSTRRLLAVIALSALSACAHTGVPRDGVESASTSAARAAIAAANAEFARALVRGDAKAMAAVFAEDGEIIPTHTRGVVSGRAAIEAYQASRVEARRYMDVEITTSELGVSGDLAWEVGTSRATIQQPQGAPVVVTGRHLAVWKRLGDGTWRIRADVAVSDPFP